MDNPILLFPDPIIKSHSLGLSLTKFFSTIAPTGQLSSQTVTALQSSDFSEMTEVARKYFGKPPSTLLPEG